MAQRMTQQAEQRAEQLQVQRLSQQQMLQVSLLAMPITELEERVATEIYDNPALEVRQYDNNRGAEGAISCDESSDNAAQDEPFRAANEPLSRDDDGDTYGDGDDDIAAVTEREERDAALDAALAGLGGDDDMPVTYGGGAQQTAQESTAAVYGAQTSFYEQLLQQVAETDLEGRERYAAEYIVGSVDDDGYLRKDNATLSDELAIYHDIDMSEEEIARIVSTVQSFDPPGIAAHDLRECLLLQIERRRDDELKPLMRAAIERCYEAFTKKHRDRIAATLHIGEALTQAVTDELRRLNPKPGASLGETASSAIQHITPDFIIETSADGRVTFSLNGGEVPELRVAASFVDMVERYRADKKSLSRREKEALVYAKERVERARGFIEALRRRQHTLRVTMHAIIERQRRYFVDGDESELRPMILKDIAEATGLDISTVSRVSNEKYAQTPWGTFPLRHFFSDGYAVASGEELSTRRIKAALRDIVDGEDKRSPLPDEAITRLLAERGFPISRRTVAKYREQMAIPVARLRK